MREFADSGESPGGVPGGMQGVFVEVQERDVGGANPVKMMIKY